MINAMYYHEPKDIKKETRKNILFIFGIIIFFLLAAYFTADGQIERTTRYSTDLCIVTKFPVSPIQFGDEYNLITLNICSDSLSANKQRILLFVFFPSDNVSKILKIGFDNGQIMTLQSIKRDGRYSEYYVNESELESLKTRKFDYISFVGVAQCIDIRDKTFFMDFIKQL